ncbi:hypothetical protein C8F04DRAFT_1146556 [Mycena alexandri]|uniref:Uncharacterized protein n=1 Tax=Mycena alexandri TaxID=1745969 RepID=A0AAD6S253_9AGAR|nr:hypothetical protein C8F04DRAFT_1146556 [Mycena alexandri]
MSIREVAAEEKRSLEEILDSGDEPVELERHIADVKALILGYWELSTEHQCRARSLIHQRALPQLSKRIENPNKFYRAESGEEEYKWWSILTSYGVQAERIEAEDPVGVLPGAANRDAWRWAVVLSLAAERKEKEKEKMDAEEAEGSLGKGEEGKESGDEGKAEKTEEEKKMFLEEVRKVIPDTGKVVLTPTVIAGYLKALANCVTAIHKCVGECAKPAASDKNWEELDLRLYILNQLIAGSKILEHVLTNKSVSDAIREAAKAFGKFLGDQETEDCVLESRNGGFVFRLLKNIVAWYRAINELLSSPFLKKDVQILVKVISVAPPPTEMTPIMDLVDELAMEEEIIDEVKTQFITKGILTSEGLPQAYSGTIHCEASMMGLMVMMEQDRCPQELVDAAGEDAAEIWAMSDTISHAIGVSTKCCFTCHRLAEYLNDQFPAMWPLKPPGTHEIIHPWSPPFGIPEGVLLNLRKDLMARLQRYIYLMTHNAGVRRENERQPDPSFDLHWEDVVQRVLRGSPDP